MLRTYEPEDGDTLVMLAAVSITGLSMTPMVSSCSFFEAAALRRSWSLKLGFFGPIVSTAVVAEDGRWVWAARRAGRVRGSFSWSSEAPVSFWTTARKFDGSAWTKVVFGVVGSDP